MSRIAQLVCISVMAGAWLVPVRLGGQVVVDKETAKRLADNDLWWQLVVGTPEQSGEAFQLLRYHREEREIFLLPYAEREPKTEAEKGRRRAIILLLGEYGASNAMRFLVDNIDLYSRSTMLKIDLWDIQDYPCAVSLRRTEQACVPYILQHLRLTHPASVSGKAIDLYARVLLRVYASPEAAGGPEEVVAVVERARDRAPKKGRPNYERLLAKLHELIKEGKAPGSRVRRKAKSQLKRAGSP